MELTLGPILFEWERSEVLDFYKAALTLPVDTVYIGEVVCVKKRSLTIKDIETIGKDLEQAGKKVVLSTLAIVSNEEELELVRELSKLGFSIEANDASALKIAKDAGRTIFAGPHIKTYNKHDAFFLESIGVKNICLPVELPKESIKDIAQNTNLKYEVFAFGKIPLAFSWRCYTERTYGLSKSECAWHCKDHPEGIDLRADTKENGKKAAPIFTINGTSILSGKNLSLLEFTEDLRDTKVDALRISPQYKDTGEVIKIFRDKINGKINYKDSSERLQALIKKPLTNGYYNDKAGMEFLEINDILNV
ncbi:MAG: U32 family peptidase [Deltaproteobacteria bacterium]|nr:U32 family peptidase [Deltaproteobacteria bacterium]